MCPMKCIYSPLLCMQNVPSVISSIPKIPLHALVVVFDVLISPSFWLFFFQFKRCSLLLLLTRVPLTCNNLQQWISVFQSHVIFPCNNTPNARSMLLQSSQINAVRSPSSIINFSQINLNLIFSDSFQPKLLVTSILHIQDLIYSC